MPADGGLFAICCLVIKSNCYKYHLFSYLNVIAAKAQLLFKFTDKEGQPEQAGLPHD